MKEHDLHDETLIDLGQASTETKGQAIFDIDVSGGQLRYLVGAVED
jgi:hypothetical protein